MKNTKLRWIAINFPECIAALAMVVAVLITGVNAITRYTISYTIWGSSEIVSLAFVWVIFPATAAAYRRGMHFGIDLVMNLLPEKVSIWLKMFARVLVLAIMFICTKLSLELIMGVSTKKMTATRISYVWYDLPALLGFALMTIYTIIFLVRDVKEIRMKGEGK